MNGPPPSAAPSRLGSQLATLARGGAVGLAGALVAGLGGFALAVVVANLVAVSQAGTFFTVITLFVLAEATCVLGSDTGMGRFALRLERHGRPGDRRLLLRTAFVPPMVLAILVGLGLLISAPVVVRSLGVDEAATTAVRLLGVGLPVAVLCQLSLASTRAYGLIRPTALTDNLLRTGGQPVTVTGAAYLGAGMTALVAAWLVPYLAAAALAVVLLRSALAQRPEADRGAGPAREQGLGREFWVFTAPRAVARISQIGLQRADVLIVAALRSPSEAAIYTVATRFVPLGQLGTQALQQVLQPRFTALLAVDDHETVRDVYRVATGWNTLLAWPLYLVALMAPLTYLGLFGSIYVEQGGGVVVILALAMLVGVAAGPADTLLLMAGRSTWSLGNSVLALALDVGLCLWLVPDHGIIGAGVAWAVAVVVRNVLGVVQVGVLLGVGGLGRPFRVAAGLTVVSVGVPVFLVDLVLGQGLLPLLVVSPICAALFAGLTYRFRKVLAVDVLVGALRLRRRGGSADTASGAR